MSSPVIRHITPTFAIMLCASASALLLAGAHLFERVYGLPPCALCLDQREAHWAGLAAGALSFLVIVRVFADRGIAAALGVLTLIYLFSASLAGFHAGVEWGFWPGPAECASGVAQGLASSSELLNSLTKPAPAPSCSEAAWRMLGLSMAGYNALISAGLAVIACLGCMQMVQGLRQERLLTPSTLSGEFR
ncbi:MAG: disulfide bond formation protein B [Pseudomonadota bacterium]